MPRVKKLPIIISASLLLLSFLTNASQTRTALYLNDIKWPPFFFPVFEQGQIGLGKEILNICLAQAQYDVEYKMLPVKRTHVYMQSGELDISVYSYKKEREAFVHYGKEPIFVSQYGFVSKKSDNLTINELNDVKEYTIGHLAGLSHTVELTKIINDKKSKNEVSIGHDIDSMFGQLLATPQRFQVMANSKETFIWRAKQLGISDKVKVHDVTIKEKPYFVTLSKNSNKIIDPKTFISQIDNCIKNLKASNKYNAIAHRYGLSLSPTK